MNFELSIDRRDDGIIEALYVDMNTTKHKVARTEEIVPGVLMVDYDSQGNATGIEILGPMDVKTEEM